MYGGYAKNEAVEILLNTIVFALQESRKLDEKDVEEIYDKKEAKKRGHDAIDRKKTAERPFLGITASSSSSDLIVCALGNGDEKIAVGITSTGWFRPKPLLSDLEIRALLKRFPPGKPSDITPLLKNLFVPSFWKGRKDYVTGMSDEVICGFLEHADIETIAELARRSKQFKRRVALVLDELYCQESRFLSEFNVTTRKVLDKFKSLKHKDSVVIGDFNDKSRRSKLVQIGLKKREHLLNKQKKKEKKAEKKKLKRKSKGKRKRN